MAAVKIDTDVPKATIGTIKRLIAIIQPPMVAETLKDKAGKGEFAERMQP